MQLRPYQEEAIQAVMSVKDSHDAILYTMPTGCGKCLGKDTPILMYDGTIKMVQDVIPGDLLMGPDSTPRTVISTCTGREMLYRVTPTKGDPYVVNESHILSLKMTKGAFKGDGSKGGQYVAGNIINISLKDYLSRSKTFKHCAKGWRAGAKFPFQYIDLDPYFVGLWLGDGLSKTSAVTTADTEVEHWLGEWIVEHYPELRIRVEDAGGSSKTYFLTSGHAQRNPVLRKLRKWNLLHNKHIPHAYKANEEWVQLELLAGLIDSDGHLRPDGGYELVFKKRELAEDVVFVARSLGFAAYLSPCSKTCTNTGAKGLYYRISISGDIDRIPVLVKRKKSPLRQQKKDVLSVGISVEPIGEGDYYGFEIDGDRLFLLGDFTVTHNTVTFANMIHRLRDAGLTPAIVLAHREELLEQAANTLRQHDEWLRVEIEQAERYAPLSSDVIVASVQTLNSAKRLERIRRVKPKVIICDEAHHAAAKSYRKVFDGLGVYDGECLLIGCTATAKRGDKQGLVQTPEEGFENCPFQALIYDFTILDAIEQGYLAPVRGFVARTDVDLTKVKTTAGDFNQGELDEKVNTDERTLLALDKWEEIARDRRTIVFCASVTHAARAARKWRERGYTAEHVSGDMDRDERRAILYRFKTGETQIVCNVMVLTEGYDNPATSCVVCLRPTKSWPVYVQQVGRGLRLFPGKEDCIVLDVVDITKDKNLVTAPAILDLPPKLDLQGHTLEETHKMMKMFAQNVGRITAEQPTTFKQLKAVLEAVDLLGRANENRPVSRWQVVDPDHYELKVSHYNSIHIIRNGNKWHTELRSAQSVKPGPAWPANGIVERMFAQAEKYAAAIWGRKNEDSLTPRQAGMLRFKGVPEAELIGMTKREASKRIEELTRS